MATTKKTTSEAPAATEEKKKAPAKKAVAKKAPAAKVVEAEAAVEALTANLHALIRRNSTFRWDEVNRQALDHKGIA